MFTVICYLHDNLGQLARCKGFDRTKRTP